MEQDKIWDQYQNNPELRNTTFNQKGRIKAIAKLIQSPCDVLTIGVGDGSLERMLVAQDIALSFLDPSTETVENLSRELDLPATARTGYSQNIEFDTASFDVVVMSEVLEHLSDEVLAASLQEVARVLKPGGQFIGTGPADENLNASLVVCPDCSKTFHRWGHVQSFSQGELQEVLESKFDAVTVRRGYFADFDSLNWKGKLIAIPKRLQAKFRRRGGNQNFLFVANTTAATG